MNYDWYGVFVADATGEIEAFLWWRGINKFPRIACIKPTGTYFTRKHRANARDGLRYRDRLRDPGEVVV